MLKCNVRSVFGCDTYVQRLLVDIPTYLFSKSLDINFGVAGRMVMNIG